MIAHRTARKERVNKAFSEMANAHVDQAYQQKRQWAMGQDERLQPEADLRGITIAELSALILSKPDTIATRELHRQKIMARIDSAKTLEELDACGQIS